MPETQREDRNSGHPCTRCLQVQATHHICQIIDGKEEIHELCDRCAEEWGAKTAGPILDLRNAKCFYCGAGATSGSMNEAWEREMRGEDYHYTCGVCLEGYGKLLIKRLKALSTESSAEEQVQEIMKVTRQVDEEMRSIAKSLKN